MNTLIQGCIIGFSIAVPVGPIGVLTIQRSLNDGQKAGFVTGLGAATADGIYGLLAGIGFGAMMAYFDTIAVWLQILGGSFLMYLGYTIARTLPQMIEYKVSRKSNWYYYSTTLLLTITSPATIFIFISVFSSLGISNGVGDYFQIACLVAGVFFGSAMWWFFLSFGISKISKLIGTKGLLWINRISGSLIIVFGLLTFISVWWPLKK